MAEKKPKDITDFTKNHRRRMRAKLRDNGGESLSHQELLEVLLFYNFRRGVIKLVVKSLFARFETLDHILHAPADDITKVKGADRVRSPIIYLASIWPFIFFIIILFGRGNIFLRAPFTAWCGCFCFADILAIGASFKLLHPFF